MAFVERKKRKPRQDTRLEAIGAEFLVLGNLLIEGISSHKTYINFPGYDLTAINPEKNKVARIQVKSRWQTDSDHSFTLNNLDCDFVVFGNLNRGVWFKKIKDLKATTPDFYVIPIDIAKANRKGSWKRVKVRDIKNYESYKNNWQLIKEYLHV